MPLLQFRGSSGQITIHISFILSLYDSLSYLKYIFTFKKCYFCDKHSGKQLFFQCTIVNMQQSINKSFMYIYKQQQNASSSIDPSTRTYITH